MTYAAACKHERFIDKLLSKADLPDGYYWAQTYEIEPGDWVVLVHFSPDEE